MLALIYYGGWPPKCACCGESEIKFLSIDHKNGGGNQHKKVTHGTIGGLAGWLVKNGFPKGYQVLCMNCNWGKSINNNGHCPHKDI